MADDNRRDGMQRVRVGLTGLAVVLLLVALATALFNTVDKQAGPLNVNVPVTKTIETNDEPLADLGMAPGAPANETQVVPPPILPPTQPAK
jgi:hypothetical protein